MELQEAINRRVSVRSFLPDPIPPDHIKEIVNLGRKAPSINNSQPWRFIVITQKELLNRMAKIVSEKLEAAPLQTKDSAESSLRQVERFATFFKDAPALIALATEPYISVLEKAANLSHEEINAQRGYPDIQSAGACMQNMLLAATDMGYGACWLSAPLIARDEIQSMLNVREPWKLSGFIALGKPKTIPEPKSHPPLDDILTLFT